MILKKTCDSKDFNDLASDTARVGFLLLITHTDRDGRVHGDPAVVKSKIFPRRRDISIDKMEKLIREWAIAGLVIWYRAANDLWIQFPSFRKYRLHQRPVIQTYSIH
jgi:hypothetical protein